MIDFFPLTRTENKYLIIFIEYFKNAFLIFSLKFFIQQKIFNLPLIIESELFFSCQAHHYIGTILKHKMHN